MKFTTVVNINVAHMMCDAVYSDNYHVVEEYTVCIFLQNVGRHYQKTLCHIPKNRKSSCGLFLVCNLCTERIVFEGRLRESILEFLFCPFIASKYVHETTVNMFCFYGKYCLSTSHHIYTNNCTIITQNDMPT